MSVLFVGRHFQSIVSIDTFNPFMKVKHINVNIVNRNTQIRVISINKSSLYMKVKYCEYHVKAKISSPYFSHSYLKAEKALVLQFTTE